MTLREQLVKRRDEVIEFFSWRFGTKYWARPVSSLTDLSFSACRKRSSPLWFAKRSHSYVSSAELFRLEAAALKLGFKPGKVLDRSVPPPAQLPEGTDPEFCQRFYFERERSAFLRSERAKIAAFAKAEQWRNDNNLKVNDEVPAGMDVDRQSLVPLGAQNNLFVRSFVPLRHGRGRPRPIEPQQLALALE